jgi:Holliday junction resolvase RusA-like endonuclease
MEAAKFTVPGPPKGKARARTVRARGGGTFSYTPEGTVLYENLIKTSYFQECRTSFQGEVPLEVHIKTFYGIPKSTGKRKRQEMLSGLLFPVKKPDIDNVVKCILDALNGVAFHDDTQVVRLYAEKHYAEDPRVEVEIREI